MKKIIIILSALLLTECSNHMVKVGKRCTPLDDLNCVRSIKCWRSLKYVGLKGELSPFTTYSRALLDFGRFLSGRYQYKNISKNI